MYRKVKVDTGTMIVAGFVMVLFLVGMFYLVGGIVKLLTWAAPVLLIVALIFDYNTVLNHGKMLINLTKRNPLMGIGMILLNVIFFPFVFAYLFAKAYLTKKFKEVRAQYEERQEGEYVDFEVVEEKPLQIDTPPRRPQNNPRRTGGNEYDGMFE